MKSFLDSVQKYFQQANKNFEAEIFQKILAQKRSFRLAKLMFELLRFLALLSNRVSAGFSKIMSKQLLHFQNVSGFAVFITTTNIVPTVFEEIEYQLSKTKYPNFKIARFNTRLVQLLFTTEQLEKGKCCHKFFLQNGASDNGAFNKA